MAFWRFWAAPVRRALCFDFVSCSAVGVQLFFFFYSDSQIKLRGFRIEIDEIETVLSKHPNVKLAVVLLKQNKQNGDKRLFAYFQRRDPRQESTASELRSFVGESLPDYMVPSAFIEVSQFAFTANGKVNRQDLPDPEWQILFGNSDENFAGPRNEIEKAITGIFQEVS
jgi:nonribosomal peptide synthetase DhbF